MIAHPAVVVHGFDDAMAALRPGVPVLLLSAPNAAAFMGCLWWRALVLAARRACPATEAADALDCGDAPGYAMAALREGQRLLILNGASPAFPAVSNAAERLGAVVWPQRPPALDVAGWLLALDPPKPNGFQGQRL
jgi:hypothetical protein